MKISPEKDAKIQKQLAHFKAERGNDSNAAAYRDSGEFFEVNNDLPRAIACLTIALEQEPDSALTAFLRGRCLLRQGHYSDGGKDLEACAEMDSLTAAGRSWHDNNLYYIGYALFNVG